MSSNNSETPGTEARKEDIIKRFTAIKSLNNQVKIAYDKHLEEKEEIMKKYKEKMQSLIELRKNIISGKVQPTESDLAPSSSLPFTTPEKVDEISLKEVINSTNSQKGIFLFSI